MTKSVLISIRPRWIELISRGVKTIEVRKTRPKLAPPFKCYIYCTCSTDHPGGWLGCYDHDCHKFGLISPLNIEAGKHFNIEVVSGKVVGEFTCDKVLDVFISSSDPNMTGYPFPGAGMTDREIMDYLGNGNPGYGWHITDLKIYDTPKELSEFWKWYEDGADIRPCQNGKHCKHEVYDYSEGCQACAIDFDGTDCPFLRVTRPPQSWSYVEGD